MADITNVINVSISEEGKAASSDNMNIVAIFTPERGDVLSSFERHKVYTLASDVAAAFGTESKTYAHAEVVFSQQRKPTDVGGYLAVIYHRAAPETVAASAGKLTGAQISESSVLGALQNISDGTFQITVDGSNFDAEIDFRTASDINGAVALMAEAVSAVADLTYTNGRIIISSKTTGSTSIISFMKDFGTGTFIGNLLLMAEGTGAVVTDGEAASTLPAETQLEALAIGKSLINFKGYTFIDKDSDASRLAHANWAQANDTLWYEVFDSAASLEISMDNVCWQITQGGLTNTRMLYDDTGARKLAAAYMARNHVVSFTAENTAQTMHLKTLVGVLPRDYDQTTINKAKKVGLDIYVAIKDLPKLLTSGANDFTDNRYNLIAFKDALQTDLFNLYATTQTKIGQDQEGTDQEVDCLEKTCRRFVKAGVFAKGLNWTSSERFGDRDQFDRSIRENGYFVMANPLEEQSQADRQARKSPDLQVACKNKGARHSANVLVNINK